MLQKLKGHKNVVYSISFNLPYADKVGTGSFDQTAKLWNVKDGKCLRYVSLRSDKLAKATDELTEEILKDQETNFTAFFKGNACTGEGNC